jgi:hypothetical protein
MVSGPSLLQVNGLPDDWAVKAIVVDGRDVTDEPVHVSGGRADVRVVLTDRLTEVTGTVSTAASADRTDGARHASVVVFPADATKWTYPSRYLRTARATEQGAFRIAGLPPNERYLALAVDYLEDGEGSDPEFLEAMEGRATSFTLGEVERRSLTLPLLER